MKSKVMVNIGLFSAIAFVLQLLVPYKVAGFLDVEFSDIPAILLAFAFGPVAGIMVELIKNMLHLFVTSTSFIGELANFLITGNFVFVIGIIYKQKKSKKNAVWALSVATLVYTIVAMAVNLFLMLPLYMPSADFSSKLKIVLYTITPFNFVKGAVLSVITLFIYKKISRLIK